MLANVLNFTIPAVALLYCLYLIARLVRGKLKRCGGCDGCAMAEGCRMVKNREQKEDEAHDA